MPRINKPVIVQTIELTEEKQQELHQLISTAHFYLKTLVDLKQGDAKLSAPNEFKYLVESRNTIYDLSSLLNVPIKLIT